MRIQLRQHFPLTNEYMLELPLRKAICFEKMSTSGLGTGLQGAGLPSQLQSSRKHVAFHGRSNSQRVECVLAPVDAPRRASVQANTVPAPSPDGLRSGALQIPESVARSISSGKALVGQIWGLWQRENDAASRGDVDEARNLQRLGQAAAQRGLEV